MEERKQVLWPGARPLIGTVVGVGIFGLPYVFSQAGFVFGLVVLVVIAALSLLTFFVYADLLEVSQQHVRFVAVVSNQLGPFGRWIATLAYFGSLWGALLAYIIVGGQLLFNILRPVLAGEIFTYQVIFWLIVSIGMVGGSIFVRRLQSILIPIFFVMIAALTLFALPHLHVDYLIAMEPTNPLLPFGALIFAFSGFSAVPECREALGKHKSSLRSALLLGVVLIGAVYALFSLAVVGMTGPFTSTQAVDGLRLAMGPEVSTFVSVIGLCTVFTAFISVGNALTNSLVYDFRGRFLFSWALTACVPLAAFLFGARDFIGVIGATGGLLGGLSGVVLLIAYERARLTAQLPKRALAVPQGLVALSFVLFGAMIIITIVGIF